LDDKVSCPVVVESTRRHEFARGDLLCPQFSTAKRKPSESHGGSNPFEGFHLREEKALRGLSWSDCAILLRSVRNSAGPIVVALRAHNIPYIVTGMTWLFDTVEVQAPVAIFLFVKQEISAYQLRSTWMAAEMGFRMKTSIQG